MIRLKPLNEQVMVITGSTSGIGLVTARKAARAGARVVLSSRNEEALRELVSEIRASGGQAAFAVADMADEAAVNGIADEAIAEFGTIDTWVNNAAVSIYGGLLDLTLEDQRKVFETNFWGVVHGCRTAVEHLRENGGALINIGSVLSERSIPLQGIYCASKHAVKGYTDTLRMELEKAGIPISVTLIKPSAIDTPYKDHAKNYLPVKPKNPPPVYAPELVAEAILRCAEQPKRDVVIGGGGRFMTMLEHQSPRLGDLYMKWFMFSQQKTGEPAGRDREGSLYQPPARELRERGGYPGHVAESSVYTRVAFHPVATGMLVAGGMLALAALAQRRRGR